MPIAIQCGACQARLKAPDQLAGKKVKCVKCGQAIPVPGGTANVKTQPVAPSAREAAPAVQRNSRAKPAPEPAREEAPPAPAKKRAKPAGDLPPVRSFKELKVPSRLRKTIEKEVGDEELVWLGRPTSSSMFFKSWIAMIVGLVITGGAAGGAYYAMNHIEDQMIGMIIAGVAGLVALTLGLPMLTMPIWMIWLVNYRDCYALTPTRALVFDNEQIVKTYVKAYTAADLQQREVVLKKNGRGSIIFGTEVVDLGTRTKSTTRQEKRHGQKVKVTYIKTKQEKANKGVGFLDIEDVEEVEAILRQTLELPPPASEDVD